LFTVTLLQCCFCIQLLVGGTDFSQKPKRVILYSAFFLTRFLKISL
jgi:hypothetical protein